MDWHNILDLFQGISTLVNSEPLLLFGRLGLILLGFLLIYLGKRGTLEPLLMIPLGLGMATINAAVLFLDPTTAAAVREVEQVTEPAQGTLFVAPLVQQTDNLMYMLQVDFLQPIYTMTFSNGLIAVFIFMGIGVLLDVGFVLARPFLSLFIALSAELGTIVTFPVAHAMGLSYGEAASIAMVGGADGPMVLFTSLNLAKHIFVPVTVVAYLYVGLTYGGYPYLIRLLVPVKLRSIRPAERGTVIKITAMEKLTFAVIACVVLSMLFPVAAPLFFALFMGVTVREAGLKYYCDFMEGPLLYGATLFLGLLLGVLCEADTILNPKVGILLVLGMFALLVSGIGGIMGGYIVYIVSGRKFNPAIGVAGVSCVPTTAKVVQKSVSEVAPGVVVLPTALGASISGVITSAILTGIFVTIVPHLK